ncbi:MAG: aldo/keto reductase [Pseudomonadales bacterium]
MKIALGTVQFGLDYGVANESGRVSPAEVERIFARAKDCKMFTVDTAYAYGESERVLGHYGLDEGKWQIVTKIPCFPDTELDANAVSHFFNESMSRLQIESLYGLLIHDADALLSVKGACAYQQLERLREQGLVKKIGASIYTSAQLNSLLENYQLDLVQLPLNVLDQRLLQTGDLDKLKDHGIEIHVRSAFLQGLLLMPADKIPDYFSRHRWIFEQFQTCREKLELSALEACIGFVQSLPQVDKVVVGVNSLEQFEEIIATRDVHFEPEQFSEMAMDDASLLDPSQWPL